MDVSGHIALWKDRARRDSEIRREAERGARAALASAVAVLRRAGAAEVWLIGSLPRGTFEAGSDLDFMVSGLDEATAWRAASEASDRCGLHVDVVRAEAISEGWRRHHQRFGERIDG